MNIKMYGADWCSDCINAKNFFDSKGIEYEFTYISHCKECTILQNNKTYKFYTDEY